MLPAGAGVWVTLYRFDDYGKMIPSQSGTNEQVVERTHAALNYKANGMQRHGEVAGTRLTR